MGAYDIDFDNLVDVTNVPKLRTPKHTSWLRSLAYPLKWCYNKLISDYTNGSSLAAYNNGALYIFGNEITWGGSSYMCIDQSTAGIVGITPDNSQYWYKFQDDYRGVVERSNYSSQTIMVNYILNREFNVTPVTVPMIYTDIYQYGYINVNFPTALYQALGGNATIGIQTGGTHGGGTPNAADNIINAFMTKYSALGTRWRIVTF